jgi:hypothetical protein
MKPRKNFQRDAELCHRKYNVEDPLAQRIHWENTELMLLASFVAGLTGVAGRKVRYSNPQTMDQALKIVLSVQKKKNTLKNKKNIGRVFHTWFDDSVRLQSHSPIRTSHEDWKPRLSADPKRTVSHTPCQHYKTLRSTSKQTKLGTRNEQNKFAFKSEGMG